MTERTVSELTREQVLAMEAGPELDALIERHLFRRSGGVDWVALGWTARRYSADIALAWEVVEEMRRRWRRACVGRQYYWEFTDLRGDGWGVTVRYDDEWQVEAAEAPTLPLAVCRAALLMTLTEADHG